MTSNRRQVLTVGACTLLASALAKSQGHTAAAPELKSVSTRVLQIAYHETGSALGLPVILLHGFPDDAHAFDRVAPALAKSGYRAFSVYLRGFGPTRFLDSSSPRMAEQAALAQDLMDFADALKLDRFAVCGFDWGCRAAGIAAALHPERIRAAVLIGGYTIQDTVTPGPPLPPTTVKKAWFQWYFNTEAGRRGLAENRRALCKFMWQEWSPTWHFSDQEFDRTAQSFDNPDFVDCVVHSYRHRTFGAPGENRFLDVERKLALRPRIEVPTVVLYGGESGFGRPPDEMPPAERGHFTKLLARRIVEGAGHFVPREKPQEVISAIVQAIST